MDPAGGLRVGRRPVFRYTVGCGLRPYGRLREVHGVDSSQRWFWTVFLSLTLIGFLSQYFMPH